MLRVETSGLDAVARDFALAGAKIIPAIMPVAQRAGNNIKRAMKKDASGHSHLGALPNYVEYDIDRDATSVTIDIGFRKEGQGNLANIAAFGSVNNAPVMDITRGLTEETPNFIKWAARIAAEAL